jgi:hypothetical protein
MLSHILMVQKFKTIFLLLFKEIHSYNIILVLSEKKSLANFRTEILEELELSEKHA